MKERFKKKKKKKAFNGHPHWLQDCDAGCYLGNSGDVLQSCPSKTKVPSRFFYSKRFWEQSMSSNFSSRNLSITQSVLSPFSL